MNLSEKKTLITNASRDKALFLGTQVFRSRHQIFSRPLGFTRRVGKEMRLVAPIERINKKLEEAKFLVDGQPSPRFL